MSAPTMGGLAAHIAVLPVVIPLLAGAALVVLHRSPLAWRRLLSIVATLALGLVVLGLGIAVEQQGLVVYQLGNWPSFAGIVLLADRLAVLMLALLVPLALASQLFAGGGDDARGAHFHALFQFQLMGLCGAFLTHDLFNLFVFFEVLLAASYGLLLHGQGGERLRQGLHYVVLNLVASALFLFAVGVLYGALGTLNMADLAARIATLPDAQRPLVEAGAWLLLIVFAMKAALLPLYFWLPRTYAAASAPAAILFAIMTKLGIYAVVRVYGLLFGADAGPLAALVLPALFWAGALTATLAALGALAAASLRGLVGYLVVGSAGVLFMAVGLGTDAALAGGLYYLVHSTLAMAAFFLLADWIRRHRDGGDALGRIAAIARPAWLGGLFLLLGMAAAGLPPFGGFLGKSLLLAYAGPQGHVVVLWAVVLGSSLLNIVALARAGSRLFWQSPAVVTARTAAPASASPRTGERVALLMLVFGLIVTTVMASDLVDYVGGSAAQLMDGEAYRNAVLGREPLPTTVPPLMRALLPRPVTSLAVAALWLLLNGASNGQLVLAVLLALAIPRLLPAPALASPRLAAPWVAAKLAAVVLYDIVKANIDVALRILGPESRIHPSYVWVPLDITSPQGIAVFASIITMTPGTLSCEISEDRRWLLVHAFHAPDVPAVAAEVKARYEAPLREIFR